LGRIGASSTSTPASASRGATFSAVSTSYPQFASAQRNVRGASARTRRHNSTSNPGVVPTFTLKCS
jgi:hypothetical protein